MQIKGLLNFPLRFQPTIHQYFNLKFCSQKESSEIDEISKKRLKYLAESHRILEDYFVKEQIKQKEWRSRLFTKIFPLYIAFSTISCLLFGGIWVYYYLEYDINITKPRVSEYHIYRFR